MADSYGPKEYILRRTSAFDAARGDKMAMRCFAKLLCNPDSLYIVCVVYVICL